MVWACFDGKLCSQLNMYEMARLQCSISFLSVCPSREYNFTSHHNRASRDLNSSADAKEVISGVQRPDYYTFGQELALSLEAVFVLIAPAIRLQLVLENLTWQVHVLTNWTR